MEQSLLMDKLEQVLHYFIFWRLFKFLRENLSNRLDIAQSNVLVFILILVKEKSEMETKN